MSNFWSEIIMHSLCCCKRDILIIFTAHFVYSRSLPQTRLKIAFIATSIQSRGLEQHCQTASYQNTNHYYYYYCNTHKIAAQNVIYNEVRLHRHCSWLVFPFSHICQLVGWSELVCWLLMPFGEQFPRKWLFLVVVCSSVVIYIFVCDCEGVNIHSMTCTTLTLYTRPLKQ